MCVACVAMGRRGGKMPHAMPTAPELEIVGARTSMEQSPCCGKKIAHFSNRNCTSSSVHKKMLQRLCMHHRPTLLSILLLLTAAPQQCLAPPPHPLQWGACVHASKSGGAVHVWQRRGSSGAHCTSNLRSSCATLCVVPRDPRLTSNSNLVHGAWRLGLPLCRGHLVGWLPVNERTWPLGHAM